MNKFLRIKKSQIRGAGFGLFTTRSIAKGTLITEYRGRISTWKDAAHEDNGYIFFVRRDHVIDARTYVKSPGRFANDARGITSRKGLRNNSEYHTDGLKVFIRATRNIKAGEEILVGYGKEYWKVIKHNRKLDRQKQKAAL